MLLTSSQVSVVVSGGIVILCTSALFLSGYVIQQRTLRELRSSIRSPKPQPKIFLPDRFKKMTTELADGTVVEIEDDADVNDIWAGIKPPGAKQQQQTIVVSPSRPGAEDQQEDQPQWLQQQQQQQQQQHQPQPQQSPREDQPTAGRTPREKAAPRPSPGSGDRDSAEPAPSPTDQLDKTPPQKPVSRAERRRLIKEELKRLAYDDKPVYYQRRLY